MGLAITKTLPLTEGVIRWRQRQRGTLPQLSEGCKQTTEAAHERMGSTTREVAGRQR